MLTMREHMSPIVNQSCDLVYGSIFALSTVFDNLLCVKLSVIGANRKCTIKHHGNGRPDSARTDDNVASVKELIWVSKVRSTPKNHRTTRQISRETGIRHSSVYRIVRQNLKKRGTHELTVANCALHRTRARILLHRFPTSAVDYFSLMSLCKG